MTFEEELVKQCDYYVYTDGACSNNGSADAKAGIGIYFGENDRRNIAQRVKGKQSNNTAELGSFIILFDIIKDDICSGKQIGIVSDSIYAIRCVNEYGKKQEAGGWKKDIPNKELVKLAYELYKPYTNITFIHVKGHTGADDIHSKGNDAADKLANKAIGCEKCPYLSCGGNYESFNEKIYLNVAYSEKDEAKSLGARWDPDRKLWYTFSNNPAVDQLLAAFK